MVVVGLGCLALCSWFEGVRRTMPGKSGSATSAASLSLMEQLRLWQLHRGLALHLRSLRTQQDWPAEALLLGGLWAGSGVCARRTRCCGSARPWARAGCSGTGASGSRPALPSSASGAPFLGEVVQRMPGTCGCICAFGA